MLFEQRINYARILDPRTKMIGLLFFCFLSLFIEAVPLLLIYLAIPIFLLILIKPSGPFFKKIGIAGFLFLSICILFYFWAKSQNPVHLEAIATVRAIVRVFIFSGSGLLFMLTTSASRFIQGLETLHLPPSLIFVLTVTLRFFPLLLREMELITDNIQGKGIGFYEWFRHPVHSGRAFVFPIIIRALKKADTLAMAATVRGFGAPTPRTCRQKLAFSTPDFLFFIVLFLVGLTFYYSDRYTFLWGL